MIIKTMTMTTKTMILKVMWSFKSLLVHFTFSAGPCISACKNRWSFDLLNLYFFSMDSLMIKGFTNYLEEANLVITINGAS